MKLVKNALIMDCLSKENKLSNIYYENGRIVKITPASEIDNLQYEEIIDANGLYVTSGIIDSHTHLGIVADSEGASGWDGNERTDPVTPNMRSIDAIDPQNVNFREALEAGITVAASGPGSANVIGGTYVCLKTYGHNLDKMIIKYPLAMKIAFGENPRRVYGLEKGKMPITRMGIAALLRETIQKTIEYKNNSGRKFDAKLEAMLPVINKEIPLKAHAHRADDLLTAVRIAKEFDLDITLEHCTGILPVLDDILSETKKIPLTVGPTLGARTKIELRNKSFKDVAEISKKADICITTDAPVIPLEYLPLCVGLAIDAGMDEWKGLESVTINPARTMGIDKDYGSLEVGKVADIVIWKNKPFVSVTSPKIVIAEGNKLVG